MAIVISSIILALKYVKANSFLNALLLSVAGVCSVFPGSEGQRHQTCFGWTLCGNSSSCSSG